MWRHITGVEQPAKQIKLDNNEKLERKGTYDQIKRKRKFQTSWQKNRNWLVHNSEIDRMTCSVCIQYVSSDRMTGDAGDDDVSSDDNTDILSSL